MNDPASAEGYTVIFNKARNDKKTGGGKPESPAKVNPRTRRPPLDPSKTQSVRYSCIMIINYKYIVTGLCI